jgi:hypothetical protein
MPGQKNLLMYQWKMKPGAKRHLPNHHQSRGRLRWSFIREGLTERVHASRWSVHQIKAKRQSELSPLVPRPGTSFHRKDVMNSVCVFGCSGSQGVTRTQLSPQIP